MPPQHISEDFELITLNQGLAMIMIDYEGAPEARSTAKLTFENGCGVLHAPGQTRILKGLVPELFTNVALPFQVAEVDQKGQPMRIYSCNIEHGRTGG